MKQKSERAFNGTKYSGDQTSETARAKSAESGLQCQCDVYEHKAQTIAEIWRSLATKKYVQYATYRDVPVQSILNGTQAVKIKFANGLMCVLVPMSRLHEQSGRDRHKGQTYFPTLDYCRNNDSITTFAKNCQMAAKRLGL